MLTGYQGCTIAAKLVACVLTFKILSLVGNVGSVFLEAYRPSVCTGLDSGLCTKIHPVNYNSHHRGSASQVRTKYGTTPFNFLAPFLKGSTLLTRLSADTSREGPRSVILSASRRRKMGGSPGLRSPRRSSKPADHWQNTIFLHCSVLYDTGTWTVAGVFPCIHSSGSYRTDQDRYSD